MVVHEILYSNGPIAEVFHKCRHFYEEKLYFEHVRILFNHRESMLDYVGSRISAARHGLLHTGQLSCHFFLTNDQSWAEYLGPKLHPGGGFFGP